MAFGFGNDNQTPYKEDPSEAMLEELRKIRASVEKIVADVDRIKVDVDRIAQKTG
jgi:hypothetical protein